MRTNRRGGRLRLRRKKKRQNSGRISRRELYYGASCKRLAETLLVPCFDAIAEKCVCRPFGNATVVRVYFDLSGAVQFCLDRIDVSCEVGISRLNLLTFISVLIQLIRCYADLSCLDLFGVRLILSRHVLYKFGRVSTDSAPSMFRIVYDLIGESSLASTYYLVVRFCSHSV